MEPDLPFSMQTRQGPQRNITLTGDDIVVDTIDLKKIVEELVGLEEIPAHKTDIVQDQDKEWVDDRSKPEVEIDDEQQQSYEQELMNMRVLEWLDEMTSGPKNRNQCHDSGRRPREQ